MVLSLTLLEVMWPVWDVAWGSWKWRRKSRHHFIKSLDSHGAVGTGRLLPRRSLMFVYVSHILYLWLLSDVFISICTHSLCSLAVHVHTIVKFAVCTAHRLKVWSRVISSAQWRDQTSFSSALTKMPFLINSGCLVETAAYNAGGGNHLLR